MSVARIKTSRIGNIAAAVNLGRSAVVEGTKGIDVKRRMIAQICRAIGRELGCMPTSGMDIAIMHDGTRMTPRMRQTLEFLLHGDSEKQIATKLAISRHTVHVYVKALHKGFDVCSRAELLAKLLGHFEPDARPDN